MRKGNNFRGAFPTDGVPVFFGSAVFLTSAPGTSRGGERCKKRLRKWLVLGCGGRTTETEVFCLCVVDEWRKNSQRTSGPSGWAQAARHGFFSARLSVEDGNAQPVPAGEPL
ncbi:unnamed protein product [Strongylus vulgaris]|uniref:Uncharacterized protein n=1 Tax=Strongylus vulgaris TaxID=40348 RepID=A0A3P7LY26_STRVU|nr:unnamed protein product [Strongylus vulgaris]